MELIPHPLALPGCCFKCRTGSENRDWFVDFDFSMDNFGAVIICNECVWEMAHTAGMITAMEASKLKSENKALIEQVEAYKVRTFGLEQAIDGLRLAGSSIRADSERVTALSDDSTEQDESPEPRELGEGEGSTPESLHDEGVAIVSDDAGSDARTFRLNI